MGFIVTYALLLASCLTVALAERPDVNCETTPAASSALLQRAISRNETDAWLSSYTPILKPQTFPYFCRVIYGIRPKDACVSKQVRANIGIRTALMQEHADGYVVILMFFGSILLGALVMMGLERVLPALPYTVAMFLCGIVFASWHFSRTPESRLHEGINPHLLFYSFLPPLIFSEAMKLNVRLVQKCFAQVFLLACPGVLLGTGMVALVARYILPYGWTWSVSLTFGAVLSATDPVAVVALFNTLGVSPRLTMSPGLQYKHLFADTLRGYLEDNFSKNLKALQELSQQVKAIQTSLDTKHFARSLTPQQLGTAVGPSPPVTQALLIPPTPGQSEAESPGALLGLESSGLMSHTSSNNDITGSAGVASWSSFMQGDFQSHKKKAILAAKTAKLNTVQSQSFETEEGEQPVAVFDTNLGKSCSLMCVVQSAWFTYLIQATILVNLIILGVEVDTAARLSPGDEPQGFWVANVVIVLIFVLELLMKLLAHGVRQFFCGSERWWNLFD
eukprot:s1002_g1.t1